VKGKGIRYERQAHQYLIKKFGTGYAPGVWFRYLEEGATKPRFCQTDGIWIDPKAGRIVIIEIKLRHTSVAWFQLNEQYYPIIRHLFPESMWKIGLCEVVAWYAPNVPIPGTVKLLSDPRKALPGAYGVHIWNPRYKK